LASKQVTLEGQVLHGHDRYGWWQVNKIEGWDETPPEKSTQSDVVNGHGAIAVPVYYGSRTVTVSGRLVAKGHELALQAKRALSALLLDSGQFSTVSDDGVELHAQAWRGRITPGPVLGRWMTFDLELKFPDPFRYGNSRPFSSAVGAPVEVFQRGTAPAWPVVTVTGSMPEGYELTLGGQLVEVTKGLASGSTHTIDMRTGILRENGSRIYGSIGIAEYFAVKPGPSQSFYSVAATGSGNATIRFNDTYI